MRTGRKLLLLSFWLAVLLTVLGYFITFVPGAECGWFLAVAVLSAPGLFIPRRTYRVGAVLLLALSLATVYTGYRYGVVYRQWSSTHGAKTR